MYVCIPPKNLLGLVPQPSTLNSNRQPQTSTTEPDPRNNLSIRCILGDLRLWVGDPSSRRVERLSTSSCLVSLSKPEPLNPGNPGGANHPRGGDLVPQDPRPRHRPGRPPTSVYMYIYIYMLDIYVYVHVENINIRIYIYRPLRGQIAPERQRWAPPRLGSRHTLEPLAW